MINVALCGLGKAGTEFVKNIIKENQYRLTAVFARNESPTIGKKLVKF